MYDKSGCGERLRKLRKMRNLTQEEVARDIGGSVDTVRKLEQGKRMPSVAVVDLLRVYYKTTADYIIAGVTSHKLEVEENLNSASDRKAKIDKIAEAIRDLAREMAQDTC